MPAARALLKGALELEHGQGGQDALGGNLGLFHHLVGGEGGFGRGGQDGQLIVGEAGFLLVPGDQLPAWGRSFLPLLGGLGSRLGLVLSGQAGLPPPTGERGAGEGRGGTGGGRWTCSPRSPWARRKMPLAV